MTDREFDRALVRVDRTAQSRDERFELCERRVQRALAQAGSLDEVGSALAQAVTTALDWTQTRLWVVDDVTASLRLSGHWSRAPLDGDEVIPEPIAWGSGISGTAWATAMPIWIPDVHLAQPIVTKRPATWAARTAARGLRSVIAIPVRDGHSVVGVLTCVADRVERDGARLIAPLTGIADLVGHFLARCRARDLALELARTTEDFLTLVGHEMSAPLSSIVDSAEHLSATAQGWGPVDQELLAVIARNAAVLRTVVDNLLDHRALLTGTVYPTRGTVDLAAVITSAIGAITPTAVASGVRLHVRIPSQAMLSGDPRRLRQVVDNLLSNAVKYSPDDSDVYVVLTLDAGALELTVVDSGNGSTPLERQRLFDRFYRASSTHALGIPGAGLGLSVTRAITEAHGGTIAVTDAPLHGTSVTVRLPA